MGKKAFSNLGRRVLIRNGRKSFLDWFISGGRIKIQRDC